MSGARRLFIGDLHGCREELDALLAAFEFRPGTDRLYSVGDVAGKGPDLPGTLRRLKDLDATVVAGNHDLSLIRAARCPPDLRKSARWAETLQTLGGEAPAWVTWMETWPLWRDLGDILMVHAGLEPGKPDPGSMAPRVLTLIRTWDGTGRNLDHAGDPPWYECVVPTKTIVFGHWAKRGLVDLPRFKGLDTGCVYGGKLTGWCPEEARFVQVDAKKRYAPIE